jgi:phosphoglycolate phosphatase
MLIIFDWDGTLLDSTGKIISCMQSSMAELGLEFRSAGQVREIIGLGLPEAIRQLYPEIDENTLDQLSRLYSLHFVAADQVPCAFYDGVMDTLLALKMHGHQCAVATGKSRKGLDRVLGNLSLETFFDASRCADETRSKPHPLMLEELLQELEVDVEGAIMIGDTEFDLAMAGNVGMASIAVTYGAHGRDRLLKHNPRYCIDHFPDLLPCIQGK